MDKQFRVLVAHFFGRFFDVESSSTDVDSRTRVIQFLALLTVPGLMISFFMLADHPAGSMFVRGAFSETDRLWLRVGDRYVFVAYAMVVMGLLMTFKWDSLFPDRRDYLILTSLPISQRRWFAAKVLALCGFLCLFVIAINLFSLLLVPRLLAEQSKVWPPSKAFWQSFIAHAAGTLGGSTFAALFFAALQGVLINVLTPDAVRRISPRVQMFSIAALVTLLLVIPLVKDSIPALVQNESPLLDYFPLMWFLGLYDALLPGATLMPQSVVWARTALNASVWIALVFAVSHFVGYWRYSRKVLESVDTETFMMRSWKKLADGILDRVLLTNSVQRGTFHFIGKISSRSTKHRLLTALYAGIGIALALSSLFAITRGEFRVSTLGALAAPLILSFVMISGLRATFNVPAELNANWMFQVAGDSASSHFLAAIRKWVFLNRIIPLFAMLAVLEFGYFNPRTAAFHLMFDLLMAALLIEVFFFKFNKVPFTCSYSSSKFQMVAIAGGYLYAFTMYVGIASNLKRSVTASPLRMIVFLFVAAGLLVVFRKLHRARKIVYNDDEPGFLSLSSDAGYWAALSPRERAGAKRRVRVGQDHIRQFEPSPGISYGFALTGSRFARAPSPGGRGLARVASGLLQDFRYGARILWKSPGLCATAAILIALVIGVNMTIYSMVHAFITRSAPGVRAQNLVVLGTTERREEPFHSYPEYLEFASQTKTLRSLVGYGPEPMTLGTEEGSSGLFGGYVTTNYFEGLDVEIVRGRGFTQADDLLESSGLVVVISYRVWQEEFHGADDAVGRPVTVNGHPATVVGVAGPLFQGAELAIPDDVWVPAISYFRARGRQRLLRDRNDGGFGFMVLGQLRPNVSLASAQAEFATISARLKAAYPQFKQNKVVRPIPYSATTNAGISHFAPQFLAIFSVVTALTLVIVCANVANLLLARAVVRQRETAVRQSLGASRARILRTLVAEGLAISAVAWIAASIAVYWVSTYVPRLIVPPGSMNALGMRPNHMNMDLSPDMRVVAYAMVLALAGTVFFCIAPAVRMWNQELLPGLKTGEHSVVRGRSRLSSVLVVIQLGFSVVLLTGAGLVYRSLPLMGSIDVGFKEDRLLLVSVNPTLSITNREANLAFLETARERIRTVTGVEAVSYVRLPPPYALARRPVGVLDSQQPIIANTNYIGPDYLGVLGLTPVLGREFSPDERLRNRRSAIVNQELARVLWPGQSALGQMIPIDGGRDLAEVVGVTPNVLFSHRDERYFLFLSEQQDRTRTTGQASLAGSGESTFYVRYAGNLDSIGPAIRRAVRDADQRVPVTNMRTMETQLERATSGRKTLEAFLSLFSGGSLFIATLGQYAVIAFEMKRRKREFGIRVAMVASTGQIQTSVLKEGLALTAIGLAIGFGLSLTVGLAFRGLLPGVTPTDWRAYAEVFAVLGAASLLACYLPARRASRVDPLVALRYE